MQLDCYFSGTKENKGKYVKIFTRPYDDYWWATGFVKGQLTKYNQPRTELKVKGRITLKTQEMADIFVEGLKTCGSPVQRAPLSCPMIPTIRTARMSMSSGQPFTTIASSVTPADNPKSKKLPHPRQLLFMSKFVAADGFLSTVCYKQRNHTRLKI